MFARIETVGRESLAELRRMLGVLRDTGDERGLTVAAAGNRRRRRRGRAVVRDRRGHRAGHRRATSEPLAPGIELAAYRIVQEALTNVRKHAGPTGLGDGARSRTRPHVLVVEVTDDGRGAATSLSAIGAGHGLIGMRERVEIYGGEFTAGPRPGGGYAVRAVLPIVNRDSDEAPAVEHGADGS